MTQSRSGMESLGCRGTRLPRRARGPRRALTLMEVLLTLGIITIICGVTWISLQRPLARQRLQSAVDTVRTDWCQARVDAMKSGHTYAFRYLVHGERYHLGPEDDPSQFDSAAAAQPLAEGDGSGNESLPSPIDKSLPRGIRFLPSSAAGTVASSDDDPEPQTAETSDGWSDPIYFYADGSTSDARLLLAADGHLGTRLRLRGITGSVTIDDVTIVTQ
jgi:hypothetical protein